MTRGTPRSKDALATYGYNNRPTPCAAKEGSVQALASTYVPLHHRMPGLTARHPGFPE
ncbi:hypothetical protein [Arthrobacter sp. ISL-65]|uniref:hypothetical protein n=1 Tax=Arthrobacter sp. ISL-65 TaxID=2819112 RepID=UPI001BEB72BF|nr:hypothetical protein [Arthrobacter sp. ISL-65]MBT2547528.1 hypothetical protein [Arthrobacter sp. ISL-65]